MLKVRFCHFLKIFRQTLNNVTISKFSIKFDLKQSTIYVESQFNNINSSKV